MTGWKTLARRAIDAVGLTALAHTAYARWHYARDADLRRRNARFRKQGAPDGLPLPPPRLVFLVAGHHDLANFYAAGEFHANYIRKVLQANGREVDTFSSILDFGCGCGRVVRHWGTLSGCRIHGTDVNLELVRWCRRALPFAEFRHNRLATPLPYESDSMDFVYAISVFTHLSEELQEFWMGELRRILKPRGLLLITTKGTSRLEPLDDDERRRFAAGEVVVKWARHAGSNWCAAFHPEAYVRRVLARDLEVVDFVPAVPGGEMSQDAFLLRKPFHAHRPDEGRPPGGRVAAT
jgi:ubiquinone/menaquinone biosynthesis C-methylase UbiE